MKRLTRLTGIELIRIERQRQIESENYTSNHDDALHDGALAIAGACYVFDIVSSYKTLDKNWSDRYWEVRKSYFPFDDRYFKPTWEDPIKQLTKAGALIAAEIDRLQRAKSRQK